MFLDYRRIANSIPGKPALNEHMYWRKANAIHKFFIDTCADGIDEWVDHSRASPHINTDTPLRVGTAHAVLIP